MTAEDVCFRYPLARGDALAGVDVALPAGRASVLCGANGSGRTTLWHVLADLAPRHTGGRLAGRVVRRGRVALVMADPFVQLSAARATVRQELAFGLECRAMAPAVMAERVDAGLEAFDLLGLAARDPLSLSGGEAARLALACQWVTDPDVLLVDEIDAQLDPAGALAVRRQLAALAEVGRAVGWVTARLDALSGAGEPLGDAPTVVLAAGRVVARGSVGAIAADGRAAAWGVVTGRVLGAWAQTRLDDGAVHDAGTALDGLHPIGGPAGLDVVGLTHRFAPGGPPVLDGVSLAVGPGEITALVGPNGSGKTTLLRCVGGLARPTDGAVGVGGREDEDLEGGRMRGTGRPFGDHPNAVGPARGVGYAMQQPERMLFARRAIDEVGLGPRWMGASRTETRRRAAAALAAVGLQGWAAAHPQDLSPSQRRWLALAAVLALCTPVLVLDEPTAGFDAFDLSRFGRLLAALRAQGRTVVWVTHDHAAAARMADRAVRLSRGRVIADGPARDVLAPPGGSP